MLNKLDTTTKIYIIGEMLKKLEIRREYNIYLEIHKGLAIIAYGGRRFGLNNLKRIRLPKNYVGGNGNKVILNNKSISTTYLNGINIWSIKFIGDEEFKKIYKISKGKLGNRLGEVIYEVENNIKEDKLLREIREIITNIIYNNNIENKKTIITLVILLETMKFKVRNNFIIYIRRVVNGINEFWGEHFYTRRNFKRKRF